ncbi:MAG: carotenoid biosynthesis protein [Myxococcales bacterium]|nr:carotenoid biosynthesis protein [Myxococcales bacterium]
MEQRDITQNLLTRRAIVNEIWDKLPIWFLFLEGLGIHNILMSNAPEKWFVDVGISRHWFALLVLPLSLWFYGYYRIRLRETKQQFDKEKVHRRILLLAFGVPLFIWLFYAIFPFFRHEISGPAFRRMFELSNLFWAIMIMTHTLYHRGWARFVTFFGVAFVYGMALENAGIYLGYFFEPHFKVYVYKLPAPLATMVGWCIVFTCCITMIEFFRERSARLKASPALTALVTTVLAISADAQLDPLASFPDMWWRWHESLPAWWFGVPFCNYAAWFGAFFSFSLVYFTYADRADLTVWQRNARLLLLAPSIAIFAGSIWLGLMVVYETLFGAAGTGYPSLQILDAFFNKIYPY